MLLKNVAEEMETGQVGQNNNNKNFVKGGNEESQEIIDREEDARGIFKWKIRHAIDEINKIKKRTMMTNNLTMEKDQDLKGPTWKSFGKNWNLYFNPFTGILSIFFYKATKKATENSKEDTQVNGEEIHRSSELCVKVNESIYYYCQSQEENTTDVVTFTKCSMVSIKLFENLEQVIEAISEKDDSLFLEVSLNKFP
jgi:hypothetical protein